MNLNPGDLITLTDNAGHTATFKVLWAKRELNRVLIAHVIPRAVGDNPDEQQL